jgi:N-glycosylase/DNA lyase
MNRHFLFDYLIHALSSDIKERRLSMPEFPTQYDPAEIWKQKMFCILSSQTNAEKAADIARRMAENVPFFDRDMSLVEIEEACFVFLTDSEIRYRFPKSKARQISQCWFSFVQVMDEYEDYISSFDSERRARSQIVERFPGLGWKQGSMFLRNIGASKSLSVIDVHMLFYLDICHGWRRYS